MLRRPLRTLLAFLLLTVFLSGLSLAREGDDLYKHPREMTFPPLTFTPPKATRHLLDNGMVVYLLEDPELPLIRLSALIRAGSVYDPPGQAGLAQVAAAAQRDGGTPDQSPAQVNEALDSIAARLEFSMGRESGTASLSVPKKDFPAALTIFAGLLARPAFDPAQFELARQKEIEALRRSNDSAEEIAYREFRKVLFAGNPRGQVPTLESLQGIQREDLLAFHQNSSTPTT
jgi:zinc protease